MTNTAFLQKVKASGDQKLISLIKKISPINQDSPEALSYLQDESHLGYGQAEAIYFPETEEQVSALLTYFQKTGKPVTISGAHTGVVGGAVPQRGILLSTEKMNRILGIRKCSREKAWFIEVEPGVRLRNLQKAVGNKDLGDMVDPSNREEFYADPASYFYPPDPTEDTALIGGMAASNSSGARSFIYGSTRNHIHRMRIILANGELLDISRGSVFADKSNKFELMTSEGKRIQAPVPSYHMPEVKNAAGYYTAPGMDLLDLFIGSEGTLGVITFLELKLIPGPENIFSGIAFFSEEQKAYQCAQWVRKERVQVHPTVLEFFDSHSLNLLRQKRKADGQGSVVADFPDYARSAIFFEQFCREEELEEIYENWQEILEAHQVNMEDTWGGFEERDLVKMKNFRHALPEILNDIFRQRKKNFPDIHKISADIALPERTFQEMILFYRACIEKEGLEYVLFGHIGECHLHLNILPRDTEEMEKSKALSLEFAKKAVSLGGTISAEHGIGKLKHQFLEVLYGPEGVQEMVRLKLLLDPKGLLGRGNIFPERFLPAVPDEKSSKITKSKLLTKSNP